MGVHVRCEAMGLPLHPQCAYMGCMFRCAVTPQSSCVGTNVAFADMNW